jgi:hypothetical protein
MRTFTTVARPIILLIQLVTSLLQLTGRFVALLVGLLLIGVGVLPTLTLVGAIVGIPLIWLGWQLIRLGLS